MSLFEINHQTIKINQVHTKIDTIETQFHNLNNRLRIKVSKY